MEFLITELVDPNIILPFTQGPKSFEKSICEINDFLVIDFRRFLKGKLILDLLH